MTAGELAYKAFCEFTGAISDWDSLPRVDQTQWEYIASEVLKQHGQKCPRCPVKKYGNN